MMPTQRLHYVSTLCVWALPPLLRLSRRPHSDVPTNMRRRNTKTIHVSGRPHSSALAKNIGFFSALDGSHAFVQRQDALN